MSFDVLPCIHLDMAILWFIGLAIESYLSYSLIRWPEEQIINLQLVEMEAML